MTKSLKSELSTALFILLTISASPGVFGQAQKPPSAQISGRVMIGDKPAADVPVVAYPSDTNQSFHSLAQSTTDADGRYTLSGLPSGQIGVSAVAPTFSLTDSSIDQMGRSGKSVNLSEGESVSGIDFSLASGVVITGRITDAEGKPVIGVSVSIYDTDKNTPVFRFGGADPTMFQTDDRGIYRVYGIPAGKYIVSAGQSSDSGSIFTGGLKYPLTYHPNVTERTRAKVIELSSGGESTGVDIQLGVPGQSFYVRGKFIDADTGQPVSNQAVAFMREQKDSRTTGSTYTGTTDARGEFIVDGFSPGQYSVYSANNPGSPSTTYSDATRFQIVDADVTDIEVKIHQGATILGQVVHEGAPDPKAALLFKSMSIYATPQIPKTSTDPNPPQFIFSRVSEDGSFALTGLAPGKIMLNGGTFPLNIGLEIRRIEREGVVLPKGVLDISAGEKISGIRFIVATGTGSVHGTVTLEGMPASAGMILRVTCRRLAAESGTYAGQPMMVDARGQFLINGLTPGDYEVRVNGTTRNAQPGRQSVFEAKQTVTVTDAAEAQILLDLHPLERRGEH